MSVNALLDPSQLRGLPYETAKLYGMPNIGAWYATEDVRDYVLSDLSSCAICGRQANNVHHEPPRGRSLCVDDEGKKHPGSFLLATPVGKFVLLPALIAMCGSGTTGCHGQRHGGNISIRWEWDSEEEERKWWDGTYLSRGLHPNCSWLFEHGRYAMRRRDGSGLWTAEWSYRGDGTLW